MANENRVQPVTTLVVVDLPGIASVLGEREIFTNISSVPGGKAFHAAVGGMQFLYTEEPTSIGFLFEDNPTNRDLASHLVATAGYHAAVVTSHRTGGALEEIEVPEDASVNDFINHLNQVRWLPVLMPASDGDVSITDPNVTASGVSGEQPASWSISYEDDDVVETATAEPEAPSPAPAPAPAPAVATDPSSPPPPPAWLSDIASPTPEPAPPAAPAVAETPFISEPVAAPADPSMPPPPPSWLSDIASSPVEPPAPVVDVPVIPTSADPTSPPPPPSWLSDIAPPAEEAPATADWMSDATPQPAPPAWDAAPPAAPAPLTPQDAPAWDVPAAPPAMPGWNEAPPVAPAVAPTWDQDAPVAPPAPPAWEPAPSPAQNWDAPPPPPPAPLAADWIDDAMATPPAPILDPQPPAPPAWVDASPVAEHPVAPPAPPAVPNAPDWMSGATPPPPPPTWETGNTTVPQTESIGSIPPPPPVASDWAVTPPPPPPAPPSAPEWIADAVPPAPPAAPEWLNDVAPLSPPPPPVAPTPAPTPNIAPPPPPSMPPAPPAAPAQDDIMKSFEQRMVSDAPAVASPAPTGGQDATLPSWREVRNWAPMIQPRRRGVGEPIKVIAITVPKGGTGKTSTSVNGAAILASTGKRVLYVDANAQQADGADLLGVPASAPTIMDLTQGGVITRDRAMAACTKIPGNETLWALLGPRDPRQANPLLLTPQVYCEAVDALKDDFDYILIDGPIAEIFREIIELFILTRADYILSAVTPDVKTVMNTYKWFTDTTGDRFAGAAAYPADQVGWFLNRYEDDIAFDESDARASLRRPNEAEWRYLGKVPDLKSVRRAGNMNQIPDDKEYVSSLAEVLFNATSDPALQPLMAGKKSKRFSKKG